MSVVLLLRRRGRESLRTLPVLRRLVADGDDRPPAWLLRLDTATNDGSQTQGGAAAGVAHAGLVGDRGHRGGALRCTLCSNSPPEVKLVVRVAPTRTYTFTSFAVLCLSFPPGPSLCRLRPRLLLRLSAHQGPIATVGPRKQCTGRHGWRNAETVPCAVELPIVPDPRNDMCPLERAMTKRLITCFMFTTRKKKLRFRYSTRLTAHRQRHRPPKTCRCQSRRPPCHHR